MDQLNLKQENEHFDIFKGVFINYITIINY